MTPYISIAEAVDYLKVGDKTVHRLIADWELIGGKTGRLIRGHFDEIVDRPLSTAASGRCVRYIVSAHNSSPVSKCARQTGT